MINESVFRHDMIEVGKRLYQKCLVASNDGNISTRISENEILITPTGVCKGDMSPDQILKVDMEGKVISGFMKPTSEMKMHLAVYRKRNDVKAVVHAHPPKATAFAVAGKGLDKITLPEVVFSLGKISFAEYGTPTTEQIPIAVEKHIGTSDALLLANHGALTVGSDVFDAYYKMETLEHFASISLYAKLLGGERVLSKEQAEELFRVRTEVYGKSNINCTNCGACTSSECKTDKRLPVEDFAKDAEAGKGEAKEKSDDELRETIKRLVMAELQKLSV